MPPAEAAGTVAELVSARERDAHPGLLFEGRVWSWGAVVERMQAHARLLAARRPPGPFHVGVLLDNVPDHVFLIGGAALAGATVVALNATRRGEELARDIAATDCGLVIVGEDQEHLLAGLDLSTVAPDVLVAGTPAFREELAAVTGSAAPQHRPHPADLLLLLFTSGSTGAPKAVRVTTGRAARAGAAMHLRRQDVLYCAMPLFHGNALMSLLFPALGTGCSLVLRRRFSASTFLPDIREHGCTFTSTVGRALSYVLATDPGPHDRDHHLRAVLAPESSTIDAAAFRERFGCAVVTGYGSSENAIVLVPRPGHPPDALGLPADGSDVAVVDPDTGHECPRAEFDEAGLLLNAAAATGEIVGRDALTRFEGYYRNAEATAARTRGGWYWSGDLGYRDANGVFFFAGRTADWLRVDGENFAAAPVERLLARCPGVTGVAVFGVPDERTADDQVMAVLELADPGAFDPEAFDAFLDGQRDLGTKWRPRYVRAMRTLPVGGTDKVDRQALRAQRWGGPDPVWWRPDRRGPLEPLLPDDVTELHRRFAEHGRSAALQR